MLKAIVLATAIISLAGSAQAAGYKGSYWSQTSYAESSWRQARVITHQRRLNERTASDIATINAGMQKSGAKYDAAMNAGSNDLKGVVTGTTCLTCR
jgi:hypothetical protein